MSNEEIQATRQYAANFYQAMNHEEILATKALLDVQASLEELRRAVTQVKALHHGAINAEQERMIEVLMNVLYADDVGVDVLSGMMRIQKTGDGLFWRFDKFLPAQNQPTTTEKQP